MENLACDCKQPKKKKSEGKDRQKCYRGVYYERARGIKKFRKEEVSCDFEIPLGKFKSVGSTAKKVFKKQVGNAFPKLPLGIF